MFRTCKYLVSQQNTSTPTTYTDYKPTTHWLADWGWQTEASTLRLADWGWQTEAGRLRLTDWGRQTEAGRLRLAGWAWQTEAGTNRLQYIQILTRINTCVWHNTALHSAPSLVLHSNTNSPALGSYHTAICVNTYKSHWMLSRQSSHLLTSQGWHP